MLSALRTTTRVLTGNRIEITAPELSVGDAVEVFVVLPTPQPESGSILDFLDALPPGPRQNASWEETEREFQNERDAWDS